MSPYITIFRNTLLLPQILEHYQTRKLDTLPTLGIKPKQQQKQQNKQEQIFCLHFLCICFTKLLLLFDI